MQSKYFLTKKEKPSPRSLLVRKSPTNEQLWHDLRATGAVFLVDLGQGGGIQAPGLGVGSQTDLTVARVSLTCSMSNASVT